MRVTVVLAVGVDSEALEAESTLWRSKGYFFIAAQTIQEAIAHFHAGDFDIDVYKRQGYPSMGMSDTVQLSLLQGYVLPAFTANNITSKIFAYDHNWDTPLYPQTVLGGLTPQQLNQMAGTAWHGYGGAPGAQQLLQNQFPALGNWETEHSGGLWQVAPDQFNVDILEITQVLRNSGKSFVKWSLALNQNLGPNLTQNAGLRCV